MRSPVSGPPRTSDAPHLPALSANRTVESECSPKVYACRTPSIGSMTTHGRAEA